MSAWSKELTLRLGRNQLCAPLVSKKQTTWLSSPHVRPSWNCNVYLNQAHLKKRAHLFGVKCKIHRNVYGKKEQCNEFWTCPFRSPTPSRYIPSSANQVWEASWWAIAHLLRTQKQEGWGVKKKINNNIAEVWVESRWATQEAAQRSTGLKRGVQVFQ